ncbi:MAG: hypothetical protein ACKV2T_16875 [Kofleriaceae bacterium]
MRIEAIDFELGPLTDAVRAGPLDVLPASDDHSPREVFVRLREEPS